MCIEVQSVIDIYVGAVRSLLLEQPFMMPWVVDRSHMVDALSYSSLHPVLHKCVTKAVVYVLSCLLDGVYRIYFPLIGKNTY